jgi:predicted PurR-regulated permease PerM
MTDLRFRRGFLLFLVTLMTLGLIWVLWSFLLTILMAALMTGLVRPFYLRLARWMGDRRAAASAITIVLILVLVVVPLVVLVGVVVNQAVRVTAGIGPVVQRLASEPTFLDQQLQKLPYGDRLGPYREMILSRGGDIVGGVGTFLVGSLSNTTMSTVTFVFQFFILLYSMFFLLMDGPGMLRGILTYLPLHDDEKARMVARFMSITRATIKGTIVIGIIQGGLSGLAFWFIGIPAALFWTVVMVVMSILPAVGGALVWVPAAVVLLALGQVWKAIFLVVFCGLIVGSIDNLLRPRLVGRDTKMHDLMILFSTLGGIIAVGPIGFIIGPLLAGLFTTSWEIFAVAFREDLRDGSSQIVRVGVDIIDDDTTR